MPYGSRLDESLRYAGEEPFTDTYAAHEKYFSIILGDNADENLQFFAEKAESVDMHYEGTLAAETYIELLARCERLAEAIEHSARLIPPGTHVRGVAPSLLELSRKAKTYDAMTSLCKDKGDLLGFATGKLQQASDESDS